MIRIHPRGFGLPRGVLGFACSFAGPPGGSTRRRSGAGLATTASSQRGSHVCPRAGRSHCHSPCTPADHAAGATSDLPRDQKIPVAVTTPRRGARPPRPRVAAASACSAFERRKKIRLQRANNLSFPAISDLNYRLHESMDALFIWWARHRTQVLSCAKHDIPLCRRSLRDAFFCFVSTARHEGSRRGSTSLLVI